MRSRLLFASCHCYLDPSSGAALASRDLLELLAARGIDCRVLTPGVLDYEAETPLETVLDSLGLCPRRAQAALASGGPAAVVDLELRGVRVTLLPVGSSRADRAPSPAESRVFLDLAEQVLERFAPRVLLTYGGHPANLELMARARRRGIAVAFALHNLAYTDRRAFAAASAVLVPSAFARRVYAERLGLDGTVLPPPLDPARVVAPDPQPQYLTFVNPQPAKGAALVARIAAELGWRRPEIPLLVVEGRRRAGGLADAGLDLSGLGNLHRMANTPDPREFYRVSRAVLVPSVVPETFGRVAAEALLNGLPVLASDRGALPETLGDAGFVFSLPERCLPLGREVPTAREAAPWVATVERLWDDPAWVQDQRRRALREAARWQPERIARAYLDFLSRWAD